MKIDKKSVTVGADPEYFVQRGDKIVSAIGLIGGTKEEPIPVLKGALQEDNVLAEINIEPCLSVKDWLANLDLVTDQLKDRLGWDYSVVAKPSHEFEFEQLISSPQALRFGCDPDFNAYTEEENEAPSAETTLRTAGGHIHIGYPQPSSDASREICKALDVVLGIPSVLLDSDDRRRSMYGKAGAFRIKDYGVEYRSLSNFWMNSNDLKAWVFMVAKDVPAAISKAKEVFDSLGEGEVQDIINMGDKDKAASVVEKFGLLMPRQEAA